MPSKYRFLWLNICLIGSIAPLLACSLVVQASPESLGHLATDPSAEATRIADPSPSTRSEVSGFPDAPGRSVVIANCTGCHSGQLVRQNRATRAGWQEIIRWMQAKHGFWRLDPQIESQILDYLAVEYGPAIDSEEGRRPALAPGLMPPQARATDPRSALRADGKESQA